jgi:tetratricopeptide (TPR) repeat protein
MFLRCVITALMLGAAQAAYAGPAVEEAQALINKGQLEQALKRLDAQVKSAPQDADARFLRGIVLTKLNRNEEAIKAFADIARDYPQLPEPYNNLAVIYAQQGDYQKARDALEAALATHPSYATAHENLGDIYAALAGAAYNRALMLDAGNQTLRSKLALIEQLGGGAFAPKAAAVPVTPITPRPPPAPAVAATVPSPAAPAAQPAQALPGPTGAGFSEGTAASLRGALNSWSRSWSEKNVDAYLSSYSADFAPEGGLSRSTWESQRRDRITRPARIKVTVSDAQFVSMEDGRVSATFVQEYESDNFSDRVTKVLELREQGGWKIVREYTR